MRTVPTSSRTSTITASGKPDGTGAQVPAFHHAVEAYKIGDLLKANGVKNLVTVNVLEDDEVRQGVKEYSNWPTVPQLYINGEFVGGSDILGEMHESGELKKLLEKAV